MELRALANRVWMHTSFADVPGYGRVPANGLVVATGTGSIIVDTAWNEAQTAELLDRARLVVPGHGAVGTLALLDHTLELSRGQGAAER